jgi:hypothetical protein
VSDSVKGHVFDPADFVLRSVGFCRLNPEMARMVVAKVWSMIRPAGVDVKLPFEIAAVDVAVGIANSLCPVWPIFNSPVCEVAERQ